MLNWDAFLTVRSFFGSWRCVGDTAYMKICFRVCVSVLPGKMRRDASFALQSLTVGVVQHGNCLFVCTFGTVPDAKGILVTWVIFVRLRWARGKKNVCVINACVVHYSCFNIKEEQRCGMKQFVFNINKFEI